MITHSLQVGEGPPATSAAPPPARARQADRGDQGPDELSLAQLRSRRETLAAEESCVSYWRRILQGRLDTIRSGAGFADPDITQLPPVLAGRPGRRRRRALVRLGDAAAAPPLPNLAALWERGCETDDDAGRADLVRDLALAEAQLSARRAALHQRIAAVTDELVARYRTDPAECLSALPLAPARRADGVRRADSAPMPAVPSPRHG